MIRRSISKFVVVVIGMAALAGCGGSAAKTTTPDSGELSATGCDNDASVGGDASSTATDAGSKTFSNVGLIDFTGTGDVIITEQTASLVGDTGKIFGASTPASAYKFMEIEQAVGAPRMAVFVARSFRIDASAALKLEGPNPIALVAQDKIEIFGIVSGAAHGSTAAAGGSASTSSGKGGGLGGGGAAASYNAAGGGSFCGIGGAGNAIAGGVAGLGGPAYGTANLIPLIGGSAGGCSPGATSGGAGGGAIFLAAGRTVTVGITGMVHVGGGGSTGSGCGGGSAGAILIEAPTVTVAGILAANGGSGAAYTGGPYGQDGQPGTTAAPGGSMTSGSGSAADMINGGAGSITGTNNNSSGSGGGGAGRIRINSTSGAASITGVVSPSLTTTCVSQGTL